MIHPPPTPYGYHAQARKVLDGQTVLLQIDLGFGVSRQVVVTLRGYRVRQTEGNAQIACDSLWNQLFTGPLGRPLRIQVFREPGLAAPYVAEIWAERPDGEWRNVNLFMIELEAQG